MDELTNLPPKLYVTVKQERLVVQAAFKYLSTKQGSLWRDWLISDPERRLLAARALAHDFEEIEKVLTSNEFRPL